MILLYDIITSGERLINLNGERNSMPPTKIRPITRSDNDVEVMTCIWPAISDFQKAQLTNLTRRHKLSPSAGDLILLDGKWYVTHSGLLSIARRKRCRGISVEAVSEFCDLVMSR